VSVRWSCTDSRLNIEWVERDGPPVSPPEHKGFGTRLFLRSLEQFGGEVNTTFAPNGLICTISVPIVEESPSIIPPVPSTSALAAD
jgi:two-component sensor histidine kinase